MVIATDIFSTGNALHTESEFGEEIVTRFFHTEADTKGNFRRADWEWQIDDWPSPDAAISGHEYYLRAFSKMSSPDQVRYAKECSARYVESR